jgi:hypothetical protein
MIRPSPLLLLLVATAGHEASALPLEILAQSSVYDPVSNQVDFAISFNRVPDFLTVDGLGRQADGFQYWIFYDNNPLHITLPPELSALIRGVEIHVGGNLRIRSAAPPAVDDPYYGGWGAIRAVIPFNLVDTALTFSVDLTKLGDADGKFAFRLDTFEYGDTTDSVVGGTAGPYYLIPEPDSLFLAMSAILLAARATARHGTLRRPLALGRLSGFLA